MVSGKEAEWEASVRYAKAWSTKEQGKTEVGSSSLAADELTLGDALEAVKTELPLKGSDLALFEVTAEIRGAEGERSLSVRTGRVFQTIQVQLVLTLVEPSQQSRPCCER